jgi:Flp pilus assembly protein TadB
MSKIGVGIGEEFPADDSKPAEAPQGDRRNETRESEADYAKRRAAYKKWRQHRHECRRQWRKEWRARSQAFQRDLHDSIAANIHRNIEPRNDVGDRDDDIHDDRGHHGEWGHAILWAILAILAILAIIAVIALVSFVFSHIFTIVGVVAVLALVAAYYRGHDPFALDPYDAAPRSASGEAAH